MIDLRDYLEALAKHGELLTVEEEVNWNLEVAAYASMSSRVGAQVIHFNKMTGYPDNVSIATNLFSGPPLLYQWDDLRQPWGRIAIGLGLDPKIRYEEMQSIILDRIEHPIFPVEVKESACKEVIRTGDDINLFELPLPLLHQGDGGRYGTGHVLIMKDPESDWHDWSVIRWTPVAPNALVIGFEIGGDNNARQIIDKYFAQGKPAPFAIAVGGPPAIVMAATMTVPERISEVDAAGGLNLDPIRLVKAETGAFFVPADAEVVIEGEFTPGEMAEEGPYGAFTGYTKREKQPVGVVKAMTHRKDPILPVMVDGTYPCDTEWLISIFESVRLLQVCTRKAMHPVKWINVIPDFGLGVCIISIMNYHPGVAYSVARWVFVHSNLFDKIIFVDADLEAVSLQALANRLVNRTHPTRAIHQLEGFPATPLQWYVTKEEIDKGIGAGRVYIDTCWPAHWGKEDTPTANCHELVWPKEIREKIASRWKEYGFKEDIIELPEGRVFEG